MNIKSPYQSIYNNGVRPPYYEPTAVDAAFFIGYIELYCGTSL
jgi:hypothetical protein